MTRLGRKSETAIFIIALIALVLATFSISLRNDFAWDDIRFIKDNAFLRNPDNLPKIFLSNDAVGTGMSNPYYRPVTTLTFAVEALTWGDNPAGYHATNILLHLAACILLFLTAKHFMNVSAAFAAAALFAVHPANSEPVAYISARADLLCGVFLLLSFLSYLRFSETSLRRYFAVSLLAFTAALFSKIVAILLPVLLFVYLFLPERRIGAWWKHLLPYLAVAITFMAIRSSVVEMDQWGGDPLVTRLATSGTLMLAYIRYTVFPFGMKVFYDLPIRDSFSDPVVAVSWTVLAGIGVSALLLLRRHQAAFLGIAWYFGALLPVSGLVMFLYPTLIADRYLYIPLLGISLALGAMLEKIIGFDFFRRHRTSAQTIFALCLLAVAVHTAGRVTLWRDGLTFWEHAAQNAPSNPIPLGNYGLKLIQAKRFDEAERVLLDLKSKGEKRAELDQRLAILYANWGKLDLAEAHINEAVVKAPGNANILACYGRVMFLRGDLEMAAKASSASLELDPELKMPRDTLKKIQNVSATAGDRQQGEDQSEKFF
jgi:hypothetical protein